MEGKEPEPESIGDLKTAISLLPEEQFKELKQFMKKEETSRRTAKGKATRERRERERAIKQPDEDLKAIEEMMGKTTGLEQKKRRSARAKKPTEVKSPKIK